MQIPALVNQFFHPRQSNEPDLIALARPEFLLFASEIW
jgi:hypothetical protein